tara:strand:- start:3397 stop:6531 length:3135 start_codon:yes stop_codon:yes gene_type:complete
MSYKFAHFADVHWRGLSRHDEYKRAFENAFEKMRKENVDAIFIVGDIVHSKTQGISPELIDSLCWWFRSLSDIAPTFVSLGNHDGLIMNKDREDAISPIIRALDLDNLTLIKNTEVVAYNDEIDICNYSCFDEEGWPHLQKDSSKITIGLFHGAVTGSQTDIDWEMEGEVDEDFFSGCDFVFLGDIHKHQYIDKDERIAYCGSTIQQNFGETPDKGFMIWEIESKNDFSSRHVSVKHDRPYVTIDWMGNVSATLDEAESHPDFSRFRIKTSVAISQGEIKQLYSSLKEFKNASEIVMKHDVPKHDLALSDEFVNKKINLKDPAVVSSLIRQYYEKANLSDRMNSRLDDLVHKFWKSASKIDPSSGGKWSIKNLKFDNTFGYGKDNEIDFNTLDGITGIFGKNRIGKSSICGTLMYTLFNTTDRGGISNLHVVNTRKGHCKTSAVITKRGKSYKIERQTIKKEARSGKLSASTQLNLLEIDSEGNVVKDLCGEQRRDTEKVLRSIVGLPEDFLLTAFASQGEMNSFLKQKASSRKTVLSKFLELDVFERLSEAARDESAGVKQLIKNAPDRDFDVSIIDAKNKLTSKSKERDELYKSLEESREKSKSLEIMIASRPDRDLVTSQDVKEQTERVEGLKVYLSDKKESLIKLESKIQKIQDKTEKISSFKETFPIEDLKDSIEEKRDLEKSVTEVKHKLDKEKQRLKVLEREVGVLDEVPCGDNFPTCKFILNAHKAKKDIKTREKKIQELSDDVKVTKKLLRKLSDSGLEEKLEKYNSILENLSNLNVEKSETQVLMVETKSAYEKSKISLRDQEDSLHEMKLNVASTDAASQLRDLRVKLRGMKDDETELESKCQKLGEEIGLLQSKIENLIEEKEKFDDLIEQWRVFELFMSATSKNGVPLEIIRSRLPEINNEIASILQGVTGFTVELESVEGSNDMDIYINYGDSRRIIECCSGMEKMMSAMAIRVALTNVSELSKPDIFMIDEGFGALDAGNVEACSRFLESLKKWFRCIIVISHVDAVKDSVDNVLELRRKGKDSYVLQK